MYYSLLYLEQARRENVARRGKNEIGGASAASAAGGENMRRI